MEAIITNIMVVILLLTIAAFSSLAILLYKHLIHWVYVIPAMAFMVYNGAIMALGLLTMIGHPVLPSEFLSLAAVVDVFWAIASITVASIFIAIGKIKIAIMWVD